MKKLIMLCLLSCSLSFAQNMSCTPATIFTGEDDGQSAFAFFVFCTPLNVPPMGTFNGSADVDYILQHPLQVSQFRLWLGTAQFSIEETGGELRIQVPDSTKPSGFRQIATVEDQKDKHQDVQGEKDAELTNGTYSLPIGTRLRIHVTMGIANSSQSCTLGCAMQLNVYLNPPPPPPPSGSCLGGSCPL